MRCEVTNKKLEEQRIADLSSLFRIILVVFSVVLSLCPYCFKGDILLSQVVICPLIQSAMLLLPMPADADAGSCLPLCS